MHTIVNMAADGFLVRITAIIKHHFNKLHSAVLITCPTLIDTSSAVLDL